VGRVIGGSVGRRVDCLDGKGRNTSVGTLVN
jgi:hypothetical protein